MPQLKLILCDPAVRTIEQGTHMWFVSGALPDNLESLRAHKQNGQAEQEICRSCGDASIVRITCSDSGTAQQVTLWRGLSSAFLLFMARDQNGDIIISDSFRAIIASLPVNMRSPSESVVVDHFLFGNVWGENTYSEHIKKVQHGQEVIIDLGASEQKSSFFDKVSSSDRERSTESYLEEIDSNLTGFAEAHVTPEDSAVLFSGGIDSTLMGWYLGPSVSFLNMRSRAITLNARLEMQYCDQAASLLGVKCNLLYEDLENYPDQLAACTDSLGSPPKALHMSWFNDAFRRTNFKKYFIAERADALFGHGGRLARFASRFTAPLPYHLLRLATAILPTSQRFKWHEVLPAARKLREPPESVTGYAAQTSMRTVPELVCMMFPKQMIEDRLRARFQYAMDRVELPTQYKSRFHRHFEMAQWIDYFCEDTLPLYRQCAHAHSKTVLSPFITADILHIAAGVPGDQRYIKDGQGKYLLKRLLKSKLPAYAVDKRKAFPEVPLYALYPDGPLRSTWDRYPMPDFIDKAVRQEITSKAHLLSWQTIKYAIWDKTIRAAGALASPAASVTMILPFV